MLDISGLSLRHMDERSVEVGHLRLDGGGNLKVDLAAQLLCTDLRNVQQDFELGRASPQRWPQGRNWPSIIRAEGPLLPMTTRAATVLHGSRQEAMRQFGAVLSIAYRCRASSRRVLRHVRMAQKKSAVLAMLLAQQHRPKRGPLAEYVPVEPCYCSLGQTVEQRSCAKATDLK